MINKSGLRPVRIFWKGAPDALLTDWLARRFGATGTQSHALSKEAAGAEPLDTWETMEYG